MLLLFYGFLLQWLSNTSNHSCFIHSVFFLRWEIETGQMVTNFWRDACDYHNDNDDPGHDGLVLVNPMEDVDWPDLVLSEEVPVDLEQYEFLTPDTMRKKFMTLLKVRRLILENMERSGTHNHRVLDFVDVGMNQTKGGRHLNRLGVFYFCLRAQEHGDEIDAAFQPFLDDELKGSTATEPECESSLSGDDPSSARSCRSKRNRVSDDEDKAEMASAIRAMSSIQADTHKIALEIERSNEIESLKVELDIAKQMGDTESIMKILEIIKSNRK